MKAKLLLCALLLYAICSCGTASKNRSQTDKDTVSFVQLEFKVPGKLKATALELHSLENSPTLLSRQLENLSGKVSLKDTLSRPHVGTMVAFVQMQDGSLWTARLPEGEIIGHGTRKYSFEPVQYLPSPERADIKAELQRQHRLPVSSGEYSGIARIEGSRYAVVHDKSSGGGIHFFDIPFGEDGVIGQVSRAECPGNQGQESGKDNEDVVFVPSTGTLFISAESDQSIREYTLDGEPTGRTLLIPVDLQSIQPNAGFEALAYSAKDGLLWAVTEKSLQEEVLHGNMLRLQSFNSKTLEADGRYLYLMDTPQVDATTASGAKAYVHGLSAMTCLEDGRIITLEREVYVPGGSIIEKALGAFTLSTLYVIDPLNDMGGILEKRLLVRVVTSALNLANYEGMCLGPAISDGRRLLLLIADSQNGQGGLTGEYLQIISLGL